MKKLIAVMAILFVATAAQATITGEWVNGGPNAEASSLTNWLFRVTSDEGTITSTEAKFVPAAGQTFAQYSGRNAAIFWPDYDSADSVFLWDEGDLLVGSSDESDTLLEAAFSHATTGYTSKYVAALITGAQPTATDLLGNNMGKVVVSGNPVSQPIVPEPATMALLGIGGLAAVIRRRKA